MCQVILEIYKYTGSNRVQLLGLPKTACLTYCNN